MENLPEALASIKPFLVRSEEMKTADPIISYYTLRYAVSLAMENRKQDPSNQELNDYLSNMLNLMEAKKKEIGNVPDPKSHYENFITMLFVSADSEDRKTGSTKKTAQKFLILSFFIEAFNVFEDLPSDWEQKRIYCKWKTADILKAFKKGENPLPGGPNEREEKKTDRKQPDNNFAAPSKPQNSNIPPNISYIPPNNPNIPPSNSFVPQNDPYVPPNNPYAPSGNPYAPQNIPPPLNNPFVPPSNPYVPQNTPPPLNNPVFTPSAPSAPIETPKPPQEQPRPRAQEPLTKTPPQLDPRSAENSRISNRPEKKVALTEAKVKIIDQAKKLVLNGVQELEYKNVHHAITNFQNAIRALENFNS